MALNRKVVAIAVAGIMAASGASALTISNISPSWQNVNPASGITESNTGSTISLRWGIGRNQSGYDFTPTGAPLSGLLPDTAFALGQFTHLNFPIRGTTLSSVDLMIDILINGGPLVSSTFGISHNETLNHPSNCPSSSTPCDDIVTIGNTLGSQIFNVGGQNYVFSVLGFSQDGGTTFSNALMTMENNQTHATLYGEYKIASVPLPAAGWLLLGGLGGLVVFGRRKKSTA